MPKKILGNTLSTLKNLEHFEKIKEKLSDNQLKIIDNYNNYEYRGYSSNYLFNLEWRDRSKTIVKLYQKDFDKGTVRLQHSGIYELQEDIVFNPNPDNDFMPTREQILSKQYPIGKGGAYHLGFFAAITIEEDDIILNLNGHTLKQSMGHYLQQRFFALIELASSPFIVSQGPHVFSTNETFKKCKNMSIVNGTLGRSSHYGIHGNSVENLLLSDITVTDFQVAGVHLNGTKNAVLTNINICESNNIHMTPVDVLSEYSQARFIRRCLKHVSERYPEEFLELYNYKTNSVEKKTSVQIKEELFSAIEETTKAVLHNKGDIPEIFKNMSDKKLSDTNMYGLLLNIRGMAIGKKIKLRPNNDLVGNENILLHNIKIKNIISEPQETVGIKDSISDDLLGTENSNYKIRGPVADIFDVQRSTFLTQSGNYFIQKQFGKYRQNVLSNAQLLAGKVNMYDKTCTGTPYTTKRILAYVKDPNGNLSKLVKDNFNVEFCYGLDSMAHTMKGNSGLFIQGGKNVNIIDLEIDGVKVINTSPSQDIGDNTNDGKLAIGYLEVASENVKIENMKISNVKSDYGTKYSKDISKE